MSSNPVPYFSNLAADFSESSPKTKPFSSIYKKTQITFRPYLGLPCYSSYKLVKRPAVTKTTTSIPQILAQTQHTTKTTDNSILAEAETPRIVEKQWRDINQPNYLSLAAATNTVEKFVKVAKRTAKQFNPAHSEKKRKPDIFDL